MASFSESSRKHYMTLDGRLQDILDVAIHVMDFSVICGHRNKKDQNKAFKSGNSKLQFPHSKHNSTVSTAVDVAPYPIDWEDINRFHRLAGIIEAIAYMHDVKIIWGGDWMMRDYVHFELRENG
jgi:peptidoglycan L-alanyl-D-glutamate endopeptidase CwlK